MKTIIPLNLVAVLVAAFAFAFSFSLTSPVRADEASHRKAAEEMLKSTNVEKLIKNSLDQMLDLQIKSNPQLAPHKEVMRKFFTKYMSWDSIKDEMIAIYADAFTEAELKQITMFYRSPVGKKMIEKQPELMSKGMQLGVRRVQENQSELIQMLKNENAKSQKPPANNPAK